VTSGGYIQIWICALTPPCARRVCWYLAVESYCRYQCEVIAVASARRRTLTSKLPMNTRGRDIWFKTSKGGIRERRQGSYEYGHTGTFSRSGHYPLACLCLIEGCGVKIMLSRSLRRSWQQCCLMGDDAKELCLAQLKQQVSRNRCRCFYLATSTQKT
jgi:hypothetical protein